MGNTLAFLAALAAVLYLGWWLATRHPADQHQPGVQMKLKKILDYREYWGDRVAWKIGTVVGDDYGPGGVIEASIEVGDYGIFTGARTPAGTYPERQWLSLSVGVTVWRWGAWIAVRGREVTR